MSTTTPLHSPPPNGLGVYWAIRQDWRLPVFIGLGFCVTVVLVLLPHFFRLDKLQKQTFAEVLVVLKTEGMDEFPAQRTCGLKHTEDTFYWRGFAWRHGPEGKKVFVFAVTVDTEPDVRVVDTVLRPYDKRLAESLGIYLDPPE